MQKIANAGAVKTTSAAMLRAIVTWQWTKKLLYWVILSAGTVSECAFLVASLWMSINSSVHPLVLLLIPEQTTQHISELATAAYVALPECIVALATVVVVGHVKTWFYRGRSWNVSLVWSVLFGLPTVVFLLLSLITLGCSVASVSFIMPQPLIIVRALAGYMFAFVSLLYTQLGLPQERERLQEKDKTIVQLRQQREDDLNALQREHAQIVAEVRRQSELAIAELRQQKDAKMSDLERNLQMLQQQIEFQNRDLENQKALLAETKTAHRQLLSELEKTEETALQAYSEECISWLRTGEKTAPVEEIMQFTGHTKRKIVNAITAGYLQVAPRNKDRVLKSSLVNWLKNNPPALANNPPALHVVAG
jgi:hypothetical protein